MSSRFTEIAEKGLNNAVNIAEELGHTYIGSEHILLSLSKQSGSCASVVLKKNGIDFLMIEKAIREYSGAGARTALTPKDMSPKARKIVENSYRLSLKHGALRVGTEHILLALIEESENVGVKLLKNMCDDFSKIIDDLMEVIKASEQKSDIKKPKKEQESPLNIYGKNLTLLAEKNKLDAVIGRNAETERLIRILSRKTKNNPCLIGDPGVGKTAIVEGLAQRIAQGTVPEKLLNKKIYSLDLTAMVAGAKYRGDFEERIKNLILEASNDKSIILFIDEIHTIVGAGAAEGAIDASNILKPALARAEIQLIGATTYNEYRKYIERDGALERRFQTVSVKEPSCEEAIEILKGIKPSYERHHKISISDEVIEAVVRLSIRYIQNKFLPDKAIDILDEACAKINSKIALSVKNTKQNEELEQSSISVYKGDESQFPLTELKINDVKSLICEITGIPVSGINSDKRIDLEAILEKKVFGQKQAIKDISNAIYASEIGFYSTDRPRGIFMIVGESGTGKTLLAKELTKAIFFNENDLIRYDMSEFSDSTSVTKLIGSPPGYVGYQDGGTITEKIRQRPYSIVLFDEIDKAHKEVLNLLLQIMDEGIIRDAAGKSASFKDSYIIFTSNLSSDYKEAKTGFISDTIKESKESLTKRFPAEFLSRIDKIIYLSRLERDSLQQIASGIFNQFTARLSEIGISLSLSEDLITYSVEKALKERGGARSLLRVIKALFEEEVLPKLYLFSNASVSFKIIDGAPCAAVESKKAHLV